MSVITLTKENFEAEVLHAQHPVLVDFWAAWCGPCRMLAPIVDEFAAENAQITVGKVNVDEQQELAAKFQVMTIPTLMAFRGGQVTATRVGVQSKQTLAQMLQK